MSSSYVSAAALAPTTLPSTISRSKWDTRVVLLSLEALPMFVLHLNMCFFFIPGRILWPWPQWLFQTPCFLLTLLRTVSCSLLHSEPAAFSPCLGTRATPGNTLADVASTRLFCSLTSVSSHCYVFWTLNFFQLQMNNTEKKSHI